MRDFFFKGLEHGKKSRGFYAAVKELRNDAVKYLSPKELKRLLESESLFLYCMYYKARLKPKPKETKRKIFKRVYKQASRKLDKDLKKGIQQYIKRNLDGFNLKPKETQRDFQNRILKKAYSKTEHKLIVDKKKKFASDEKKKLIADKKKKLYKPQKEYWEEKLKKFEKNKKEEEEIYISNTDRSYKPHIDMMLEQANRTSIPIKEIKELLLKIDNLKPGKKLIYSPKIKPIYDAYLRNLTEQARQEITVIIKKLDHKDHKKRLEKNLALATQEDEKIRSNSLIKEQLEFRMVFKETIEQEKKQEDEKKHEDERIRSNSLIKGHLEFRMIFKETIEQEKKQKDEKKIHSNIFTKKHISLIKKHISPTTEQEKRQKQKRHSNIK